MNLLTVQKASGEFIIYDPARLRGVSTYRYVELCFSAGDRLQFTASNRELGIANRVGIIETISKDSVTVRLPKSDKAEAWPAHRLLSSFQGRRAICSSKFTAASRCR